MNLYHNGREVDRLRVSGLAELLNAPWEGDDAAILSVAPLEEAGAAQLSFVANRKAAAASASSKAACLLVRADFPPGRTVIRVPDPRAAFARAVTLLYPEVKPGPGIHPTALIAEDAILGADVTIGAHVSIGSGSRIGDATRIGPGCAIGPGCVIGSGCVLHPRVTLYHSVAIGDRAVLHAGCVLGADGFGFVMTDGHYEKFPQIGTLEIGDDVEIGANSCIDRAALGVTRIGNGTKLDNLVHVAHNCQIGNHVVIAAQTGFSGAVIVEDYAVIGGQVGIGDKARIEAKAVLGSGCGVLTSKIVRSGQVVWGTPARPLRDYLEQLANLARLPQLRKDVAELKKQIAKFAATS